MVRSDAGTPALVTRLRGTERTRDPLLVARIEAVHRVLLRARVPHVQRVRMVEAVGDEELELSYPAVQGEGLVNALRRGPLPLPRALAVLRQVCRSLAAAHAVGIEHHLLGPASIVFLRDDDPRSVGILDYGIAPLFDGHEESSCLDLHPITPERVIGGGTERSEDVYLVGCLAYWMLAGEPPFRADDLATLRRRHAIEDARRLDTLPIAALPEHIVDAVARALEKDPDDRFASVVDLDAALEPRGETAAKLRRPESSGERRIIEPALVFAPGQHREGPFPMRGREPTVQVEPGSVLRSTSLAIHRPQLPRRRTEVAIPVRAYDRDRRRVGRIAVAAFSLPVVIAAGSLAFGGREPVHPESTQVAAIVSPRVHAPDDGPRPEIPARPAIDEIPLPPAPGAMPPIEHAIALADAEPIAVSLPTARTHDASPRSRATPTAAALPTSAGQQCDLTRRAAVDARRAHDWEGLLRHTTRASCWRSPDERMALRVKALMELGRFTECARLGNRVSRPESDVQLWTRVCSKRSGAPT